MPPTYRVNLTLHVADQLEQIYRYIERDSPTNAARMIGRLLDAIEGLDELPHRYKVVTNRGSADEVRSMPVGNYLVRYHIDDNRGVVTILSVRHGARNSGH